MAEARSQQAASMTEFNWLGHRFPISNPKTRVSILKGWWMYISFVCRKKHSSINIFNTFSGDLENLPYYI